MGEQRNDPRNRHVGRHLGDRAGRQPNLDGEGRTIGDGQGNYADHDPSRNADESLKSRAELLETMSRGDIDVALANGWLSRVRRGAYRLNTTPLKLRMHLIAVRAPEAVFSLLIAAHAWGLRKGVPRDLDVYVSRSRRGVRGARVHRRKAMPYVLLGGFRFTTLTETLADLVDVWGPGIVADVVDRRYRTLAERADLIAEAKTLPVRKRAKILPILEWAPERAYSGVEARIARALQMRGFDIELNVRIGAHMWDIVHRGARLVIEFDSLKYHSDQWAFREDRARQNALTRLDYAILRYSDSDVDLRFDAMIDEICDTIAWRLGGGKVESNWDKFPCSEVYGWSEMAADEASQRWGR